MRRVPERRHRFRRFNKPADLGWGRRIGVNPPDTGRQRGGHERIPRAVGVRKQGGVTAEPVVMLTARGDVTDRIVGLELGADDYIPKPFSPRELVARVKAVLRRAHPQAPVPDLLQLGNLAVRIPEREVTLDGTLVELTPKEFELLAFLMANPGVVFSREQLLERVWELGFPSGTRTVDQHVAQLRAKLGKRDPIETVRGVGYKVARQ